MPLDTLIVSAANTPSSAAEIINAIAAVLGSIAWPILIGVLLFVFRKQLSNLPLLFDTIEFKGLKAQLRREIGNAAATVEQLRKVSLSVSEVASSVLTHLPVDMGIPIGRRLQLAYELRDKLLSIGVPAEDAEESVRTVKRLARAMLIEETITELQQSGKRTINGQRGEEVSANDQEYQQMLRLSRDVRPEFHTGQGMETTADELEALYTDAGYAPDGEGQTALGRLRRFETSGELSPPLSFDDQRFRYYQALEGETGGDSST